MQTGISSALQLLVVITPHWDAISGSLYLYERASLTDPWIFQGAPIPIDVGRSGLAWGRGLHSPIKEKQKKEWDGRGPAGIFSLGPAFGFSSHACYAKKLPFIEITEDLEGIDDPDSRYYTQLIYAKEVEKDWKSSEKMAEIGSMYALGLVIGHNIDPIEKGAGSCIFLHNHEELGKGSAGCTVMKPLDVINVISWLDQDKNPRLVQLPEEEYSSRQKSWMLPLIPLRPSP